MKIQFLALLLGLITTGPVLAQQTSPDSSKASSEQTQRRLRRIETRTTTTKLYPERDSILVLLKNRMAVLNPGTRAASELTAWFTEEARIADIDGHMKTPTEYQTSTGKLGYRNYRVRKLEINENQAQAVEVYTIAPDGTTGAVPKTATATSQLRKGPDGKWRITEMRITSK
ncbi:hypothetical protein LX87_02018 [Larkinella arboricola]|uniref:DUF4440 domain-containing protein n=1 Tax=Larkinella arboricola TaxID=643671 RepID=A0A327X1L6_LARAB|nr:hypothetical protein [Larkinella arboricola]RAK00316.1 hypothetical protein LX87_02018 [Larkinella arboricola]